MLSVASGKLSGGRYSGGLAPRYVGFVVSVVTGMANLKLEVLDLPPKSPNLFLCRAGELEFDVLFASDAIVEGEMTIVRFEPGGKMLLLREGGGQVHAWASPEAYQTLKPLLTRTQLPPEVAESIGEGLRRDGR